MKGWKKKLTEKDGTNLRLDIEQLVKEQKINLLFSTMPVISLLMIEYAARGSVIESLSWIVQEPVQFLMSLLLFYAVFFFLWANINHKLAAASICSAIWILIAAIIGCKREILGTPIMPWDIALSGNVSTLIHIKTLKELSFLQDIIFLIFITIHLLYIAAIGLQKQIRFIKPRNCNIITVISICIVGVMMWTLPPIGFAQTSSACGKDGYIRGFIVSAKVWSDLKNASGSDCNTSYDFQCKEATNEVNPNIIIVMSEAFWDVTLLPGITFSEDPIPTFHALQQDAGSGTTVSNTFGGLTDNVEFEVMTGFSVKYLPYQANAYTSSVNTSLPSLPSYLKTKGYSTSVVHPNTEEFFNRDLVYPMLGVEQFVSLEDMPDAVVKGGYVSDETFTAYIISTYQSVKKPAFMYNISVQNHWPYTKSNYYEEYDVSVSSRIKLDTESMNALKNYTQGIHDADQNLKRLIEYFKTVEEPTVIVFFGDHYPSLTSELSLYKELGYIDDTLGDGDFNGLEITDDAQRMVKNRKLFELPYVVWSNFDANMEGTELSTNYLGVYLLDQLGMELPPFYSFLMDYREKLPVNRYFLAVDSAGMLFSEPPAIYNHYEQIYQKVQNNILFGDQSELDLFQIKNTPEQ